MEQSKTILESIKTTLIVHHLTCISSVLGPFVSDVCFCLLCLLWNPALCRGLFSVVVYDKSRSYIPVV